MPIVVKADGLYAGKGVVVAKTLEEAEAAVDSLLANAMGSTGAEIVVEEFLEGRKFRSSPCVMGRSRCLSPALRITNALAKVIRVRILAGWAPILHQT